MRETEELREVQITMPTIEDLQGFKNLRLEALQQDPSAFGSSYAKEVSRTDEEWKAWLEKSLGEQSQELLLLAKDGGKYVGMIGSAPKDEKRWKIKAVYVTPEYRGKGVSKKLLQQVLRRIDANKNIEEIELSVNTNATAAVNLYKQFGFEIQGTIQDYTFGDGKQYDKYEMLRVRSV